MKIAIISENDFGFSNALRKANHVANPYKCDALPSLFNDIHNGYRPDCVFLMDDGEVPVSLWRTVSDLTTMTSSSTRTPALVYFTRESFEISENDSEKIRLSDIIFTQNNHWITNFAFNGQNIFRFPYWVDTSIFSPNNLPKQYDCISCTEDLALAGYLKDAFLSKGLTFFNDPKGGADFLNSGRIFVNFKESFVVPRVFFEASACGLPILSTPLHEYSVIESLFEEEREILYFSSLDECLDRAYLYARFRDQRELVTEKSFYLIKNYHRIEKRIRIFIKEIKTLGL